MIKIKSIITKLALAILLTSSFQLKASFSPFKNIKRNLIIASSITACLATALFIFYKFKPEDPPSWSPTFFEENYTEENYTSESEEISDFEVDIAMPPLIDAVDSEAFEPYYSSEETSDSQEDIEIPLWEESFDEDIPEFDQAKTCNICLEEKVAEMFVTLDCGHEYCSNCLARMVDMAIDAKNTRTLKCPSMNCNHRFRQQDVRNIDHKKLNSIADIQAKEWFLKQPNSRHCQTPDCDFCFINEEGNRQRITCSQCRRKYCSNCLTDHSMRTACDHTKRANESAEDQKKNEEWKKANTIVCPSCKTIIQKDGGCNHMTCKCGHEFCYLCRERYGSCHCPLFGAAQRRAPRVAPRRQEPDLIDLLRRILDEERAERERINRFLHGFERTFGTIRDTI